MPIIGYYVKDIASLPESNAEDSRYDAIRDLEYELTQRGASLVVIAEEESHQGSGVFDRSWTFASHGGLIENGPVTVQLIYNVGRIKRAEGLTLVNHPELCTIMDDKILTYSMFPELHPKSFFIQNAQDYRSKLPEITTETIVLKPIDGTYSENVIISDKKLQQTPESYPLLMQEFIDSSNGIDGITPGEHDLRIIMLDEHPALVLVRVPKPGSHVAGLRLGASYYFPAISELPGSVIHLIRQIDQQFNQYPGRAYSIDCAMTPLGPKIIELNASPALWPSKENRALEAFNMQLANHLIRYSEPT